MPVFEKLDPKERQRLAELRNQCRLRRHWMDTFVPPYFEKTGGFTVARHIIHWRCETCGTIRHDGLSDTYELLVRRYEYPDGYRLDTDEERPTAENLRQWLIKRNRTLGIPNPPSRPPKAPKTSLSESLRSTK